jgi:hypothetical protein
MSRTEVKNRVLLLGWGGALLLASIVVIFLTNTYFGSNPWSIGEIGLLWCFLASCVLLLRHYRRGRRQGERRIAWYSHPDIVFCLLGIASGLLIALSDIQKWMFIRSGRTMEIDLVPPRSTIGLDPFLSLLGAGDHMTILMIAAIMINLCWFVLALVLIIQFLKQKSTPTRG